jgi:hypothetical protein
MKASTATLVASLIITSTAIAAQNNVLFEDDFEAGNLNQWTGDVHGIHNGLIVVDPLRPGNHVLTFKQLDANGNIFSDAPILISSEGQQVVLSFDYLGLPGEGSIAGNLGGFLGVASSVDFWWSGRYWLAGTTPLGFNTSMGVELVDDGSWHHYEIDLTPLLKETDLAELHVMIEDWNESEGVPGDAYFDNIRLEGRKPHEPKLDLFITEVTLCWDSERNYTYQLQYRSNQTPGGWTNVGGPLAGTGETLCVADHTAVGEPRRFYRVQKN